MRRTLSTGGIGMMYGLLCRYNIFFARMPVRHDADGKKYLYDLLVIKKETSSPLKQKLYGENPPLL